MSTRQPDRLLQRLRWVVLGKAKAGCLFNLYAAFVLCVVLAGMWVNLVRMQQIPKDVLNNMVAEIQKQDGIARVMYVTASLSV